MDRNALAAIGVVMVIAGLASSPGFLLLGIILIVAAIIIHLVDGNQ